MSEVRGDGAVVTNDEARGDVFSPLLFPEEMYYGIFSIPHDLLQCENSSLSQERAIEAAFFGRKPRSTPQDEPNPFEALMKP